MFPIFSHFGLYSCVTIPHAYTVIVCLIEMQQLDFMKHWTVFFYYYYCFVLSSDIVCCFNLNSDADQQCHRSCLWSEHVVKKLISHQTWSDCLNSATQYCI